METLKQLLDKEMQGIEQNKLNFIKSNQAKMEYLAKHHGNRYYEMLGNLVLENYSIQDAIDKCYEYFTR